MRRIIVDLRTVTKVYEAETPHAVQALRGIDLTVSEGEFLALLGPPGAGKTSLLRVLSLAEAPTSGSVLVEGRLVTGGGPEPAIVLATCSGSGWEGVVAGLRGTLTAGARLLLADEPTGRLDSAGALRVTEYLARLREAGLAVVVATADPEVAARCPVIYRMRDGQIRRVAG